jgi:hypothetical protein
VTAPSSRGDVPAPIRVVEGEEAATHVLDPQTPVILRGACTRARAKWTEDWLLGFFGEDPCNVTLDSKPAQPGHKRQLSLRAYLDERSSDREQEPERPAYLFHTKGDPAGAAALLADLDVPPSLREGTPSLFRFYMGPQGSGTLPHLHPRSIAVNALAQGRKRWAIYQELDPSRLQGTFERYGSGAQARAWFAHEIDKLRADRDTPLWEFTQVAGDVVFVPRGYMHAALNLEAVTGFTVEVVR